MISSQLWVLLFFAVFVIHEGTSIPSPPHKPSTSRGSESIHDNIELNRNPEVPRNSVNKPLIVKGNPTYPEIHPDLDFRIQEPSSSGSEPGHSVPENPNSVVSLEIDTLLDVLDTADRRIPQTDESIHDFLPRQTSAESSVQRKRKPAVDPTTKFTLMELSPETGVMMDPRVLARLLRLYKYYPRRLQQHLFETLIHPKELGRLGAASSDSIQGVPERVRNTVEAFLQRVVKPPISHEEFVDNLRKHLEFLKETHTPIDEVELMPGTGVMINKRNLEKIITSYNGSPRELQHLLFEELLPLKASSFLVHFGRMGITDIPRNVRDAVEDFVNSKVEPKLSHTQFMQNIAEQLRKLRTTLSRNRSRQEK